MFIFFFVLAFILFIFSFVNSKFSVTESALRFFYPLQQSMFGMFSSASKISQSKEELQKESENSKAVKQLVDQTSLEKENRALRDQFDTTTIKSQNLLPARIIGAPRFIPGISLPEFYILNKGGKDNVQKGQTVVYKDAVVGIIDLVNQEISKVRLITNTDSSFTAKSLKTSAVGVVKGKGGGDIIFDNIILSEKLTVSDIVLTKGSVDEKGIGVMPDLILGKIISIDKKPSALFQSAQIKSPLDFSKLEIVFIILQNGK